MSDLPIEYIPPAQESAGIRVFGCPHPLRGARLEYVAPIGASVRDIIEDGFARLHVPMSLRGLGHAYIGAGDARDGDGRYVRPEDWASTYPAPGEIVTYRIVPQGGKGSNVLAMVLMLAVVVVAAVATFAVSSIFAGGLAFGGLGLAPGCGFWGGLAGLVTGMAVSALGMLAVNSLVATKAKSSNLLSSSSTSTDPDVYAISGASNAVSKWGAVPIVLGTARYVPPLGASNFTYISGDDQYVEQLFVVSYGPVSLSNIRLGDTGIEYYSDYQLETRNGYSSDTIPTIHTSSVTEESLSIDLKNSFGWSTRTTKDKTTRIGIDIVCPSGLCKYDSSGNRQSRSVMVSAQYCEHGTGNWIDFPDATLSVLNALPSDANGWELANFPSIGYAISISGCQSTQVKKSYFVDVAESRYDVRVGRLSADSTSTLISDSVYWSNLRSFHVSAPIKFPYPLAKIALRMKATDQLNGYIDNLSVLVTTICPDYDAVSGTWITRETNNPASLFRYVLQCNANVKRLSDAMIDLDQLAYWHVFCQNNGFTYNRVLDQTGVSVFSVLQEIASAGRAGIARPDGRWSVTIDEPKTVTQVFTPRNSWGFSSTKAVPDLPHGFRVAFNDATNDYQEDECIVYADGYSASNAFKFEQLALPGVTNTSQIYKLARHHLAAALLRMEEYVFSTSMEFLVCTRGDLVRVQHDVLMVGICSGRIKAVDAVNNSIDVDEPCDMVAGVRYTLRFRVTATGMLVGREVVAHAGSQTVLYFSDSGTRPSPGDLFTFGEIESDSALYLVKKIEPMDDFQARLTLMDYAPDIFNAASGPIPTFDSHITHPYSVQGNLSISPILGALKSDESVLEKTASGQLISRIYIPFSTPISLQITSGYTEVQYKAKNETTWKSAGTVGLCEGGAYVDRVSDGASYYVRLRFVDDKYRFGPWAVSPLHTVIGKTSLPPDVPSCLREGTLLRWSYPDAPLDLAGFKIRMGYGQGVSWERAIDVSGGIITGTSFDISNYTSLTRTWLIKAIDVVGNLSANVAIVTTDIGGPEIANIVQTTDYALENWPGVVSNASINASGYLAADSCEAAWPADIAPAWPDDSDAPWGSGFEEMAYECSFIPPDGFSGLGTSISLDYLGTLVAALYDAGGLGAAWPVDSASAWPVSGDPAWWNADWQPLPDKLYPSTIVSLLFILAAGSTQGVIKDLQIIADVPDVSEALNDVTISDSGLRLPIIKQYQSITQVLLTIQDNGGSGIIGQCIDKNTGGPLVRLYDINGNAASGLVDAVVKGY